MVDPAQKPVEQKIAPAMPFRSLSPERQELILHRIAKSAKLHNLADQRLDRLKKELASYTQRRSELVDRLVASEPADPSFKLLLVELVTADGVARLVDEICRRTQDNLDRLLAKATNS